MSPEEGMRRSVDLLKSDLTFFSGMQHFRYASRERRDPSLPTPGGTTLAKTLDQHGFRSVCPRISFLRSREPRRKSKGSGPCVGRFSVKNKRFFEDRTATNSTSLRSRSSARRSSPEWKIPSSGSCVSTSANRTSDMAPGQVWRRIFGASKGSVRV